MLLINKNTKLLIFDCDGTIANNMPIHINAWETILTNHKLHITTENLDNFHGMPSRYILKHLYKQLNDLEINHIANEIASYTNKNIGKGRPIKPTIETINKYYGHKKMIVLSGGTKKNVFKTLDALGITNLFDEIITADDNHPSKNTIEAFTLIADKYNISYHECHVFEDGVPGLIHALKAGMTVTDMRTIDL